MKNKLEELKKLKLLKEKIKNFASSKTFGSCLLLALILWLYVSFNDKYQTMLEVPLIIEPPADRACENLSADKLLIDVSGTGWYLFKNLNLNTTKRCYIKLSDVPFKQADSSYTITSVDMQKGIQNISKISLNRFFPDKINIKTSSVITKEVPIKSNIQITPAKGFALVGNIQITPANTIIKGNINVINNINEWFTEKVKIENVTASFIKQINLSDSMNSILKLNPKIVNISATIQPYAEITLEDIPLMINANEQLLTTYSICPKYFSVTLSGGIDVINKVNIKDIFISINYQDILDDSTGIIKPIIVIPTDTKLLNMNPKYVLINQITKPSYIH